MSCANLWRRWGELISCKSNATYDGGLLLQWVTPHPIWRKVCCGLDLVLKALVYMDPIRNALIRTCMWLVFQVVRTIFIEILLLNHNISSNPCRLACGIMAALKGTEDFVLGLRFNGAVAKWYCVPLRRRTSMQAFHFSRMSWECKGFWRDCPIKLQHFTKYHE